MVSPPPCAATAVRPYDKDARGALHAESRRVRHRQSQPLQSLNVCHFATFCQALVLVAGSGCRAMAVPLYGRPCFRATGAPHPIAACCPNRLMVETQINRNALKTAWSCIWKPHPATRSLGCRAVGVRWSSRKESPTDADSRRPRCRPRLSMCRHLSTMTLRIVLLFI